MYCRRQAQQPQWRNNLVLEVFEITASAIEPLAGQRLSDRAKIRGVEVPDLDAYRQVVLDHLL